MCFFKVLNRILVIHTVLSSLSAVSYFPFLHEVTLCRVIRRDTVNSCDLVQPENINVMRTVYQGV